MNNQKKTTAFQFILLMGMVSLFGDITYEGGRSVAGPYLAFLGASAASVGFATGLGEFLGYSLRLVSGFIADRTRAYWPLTFLGYGLIFSIPLLALTNHWQFAVLLIILERIGKAIRTPARDTILSYATKEVGRGWGFAIHEAMDQIGAMIGPLLFFFVFFLKGGYRQGFALLWVPAVLTLAMLVFAKAKVSSPEKFEAQDTTAKQDPGDLKKLSKTFWFYALFIFLSVAGFANFQIISYHFKTQSVVPDMQIPIFYTLAMAVDGLVALIIGKTYDRIGLKALLALPLLTLPIPFFAFSKSYHLALISVVLWGAVMGIHETIMRAAIADLTPIAKRGFAYGIFNTLYGASWFIGSSLMGLLYGISVTSIIFFVTAVEFISLPVFFLLRKSHDGLQLKY